jgi:mono/diheme cytochrome c family protein
LPPLPPPLRLPANAQPNSRFAPFTNRQQRLQAIQGASNAPGVTVVSHMTNLSGRLARPLPGAVFPAAPGPAPVAGQPLPLVADADVKEYTAKPGEVSAQFDFTLTNPSTNAVTVNEVRTSCGCTVAKLPSQPWVLEPGTNGQVHVTVDLRGKRGQITKLVYVYGATGTKTLTVKANIPDAPAGAPPGVMVDRTKNIQVATADRQAVFKNDCASCHVEPLAGKQGIALYEKACGICHDSEHRASMVPDLHHLNHSTDRIYWKVWITQGKAGSLMPAFARAAGGPLTDEQINSLAAYLTEQISSGAAAAPAAQSAKLPASQ